MSFLTSLSVSGLLFNAMRRTGCSCSLENCFSKIFCAGFSCIRCQNSRVRLVLDVVRVLLWSKKEKSVLTQVWRHVLQRVLSWGSLFRFCTEGVSASKLSWTSVNSCSEWGRLSSGKAASLKSLVGCMFQNVASPPNHRSERQLHSELIRSGSMVQKKQWCCWWS